MSTLLERPSPRTDGRGYDLGPPNPFQAVIRHPILTLLPIVALVAAAAAVGLARTPSYTAESRVSVGNLNPSAQTAPGVVDANQQLASTYSRAITATPVVQDVSRRAHVPVAGLSSKLSASPLAKSPIITIQAKGSSPRETVLITQAATDSLLKYVGTLGAKSGSAPLLSSYEAARSDAKRSRAAGDTAAADRATLKAQALKSAYLGEVGGAGGPTPVTVLNRADGATSDRSKNLRLIVVIGALAGVFLGVAVATARSAQIYRRRLSGA